MFKCATNDSLILIIKRFTFLAEWDLYEGLLSSNLFTEPRIISDDLCICGFLWEKLFNGETYELNDPSYVPYIVQASVSAGGMVSLRWFVVLLKHVHSWGFVVKYVFILIQETNN